MDKSDKGYVADTDIWLCLKEVLLGISVGYGSEWSTDGTSTFVGRTGGGSRPPRTAPIASAFGDTDGEFFDRKNFRPKNKSAEKFAVRIAEGGINGGGPWVAVAPPGPSEKE